MLFKSFQHQQTNNWNRLQITPEFKNTSQFLQGSMGKPSYDLSKSMKGRTKQAFCPPWWAQHDLVWQHTCCSSIHMLSVLKSHEHRSDGTEMLKKKKKNLWSKNRRPFSTLSLQNSTERKLWKPAKVELPYLNNLEKALLPVKHTSDKRLNGC